MEVDIEESSPLCKHSSQGGTEAHWETVKKMQFQKLKDDRLWNISLFHKFHHPVTTDCLVERGGKVVPVPAVV